MSHRYEYRELAPLPTLEVNGGWELKLDEPTYRVWLGRSHEAGSSPGTVILERRENERWVVAETYTAEGAERSMSNPIAPMSKMKRVRGPVRGKTPVQVQPPAAGLREPMTGVAIANAPVNASGCPVGARGETALLAMSSSDVLVRLDDGGGYVVVRQEELLVYSQENPVKDLDERAKEAAGNWEKFTSFSWDRASDLEDAENWTVVYTSTRDSTLLDESNAAAIEKEMEPFEAGDDPDVVSERHSHWAVGHVNGYSIRVFDKQGNVTPAFERWVELADQLSDYPILDEEEYSNREHEATLENIESAAHGKTKDDLPDGWAAELMAWFDDHLPRAIESRDDQGGYPSDVEIKKALKAFDWLDPDLDSDLIVVDVDEAGPWAGDAIFEGDAAPASGGFALTPAPREVGTVEQTLEYYNGRWKVRATDGTFYVLQQMKSDPDGKSWLVQAREATQAQHADE